MSCTISEKGMPFAEFVLLMALMVSVMALSIDAILPAMGKIGSDLGVLDENKAQYVIGALFLGMTFGQVIYGPLSDSFGRKRMIFIGLVFFLAGSLLSGLAQNFTIMLIGRLLQGFGAAAPRTVSTAVVRDLYHGREMARIISFIMAVFILIPAVAPALGQAILLVAGWRVIFVILFLNGLITLLWMSWRLPETLPMEKRKRFDRVTILKGVREVISDRITRGYTLCAGLVFGVMVGYLSTARQIFQEYFHVGDMFSVYFAMLALAIGGASILNSFIVRRLGMRKICHYALLGLVVVSSIFCLVESVSGHIVPLWQFMVFALLAFFCMGLVFGNTNAAAMEHMGHIAGVATAVIGSVSSAVAVIFGTLIGQFYNGTLMPIGIGFLCLSSAAFFMQLRINKEPF